MNADEIHPSQRRKLPPLPLLHHLATSNNLSFARIPVFSAKAPRWLIIEFLRKSDSRVPRLLLIRKDIFSGHTQQAFDSEFGKHFALRESIELEDSDGNLYLMEREATGL
jgi:hypothetical protein